MHYGSEEYKEFIKKYPDAGPKPNEEENGDDEKEKERIKYEKNLHYYLL